MVFLSPSIFPFFSSCFLSRLSDVFRVVFLDSYCYIPGDMFDSFPFPRCHLLLSTRGSIVSSPIPYKFAHPEGQ